MAGYTRQQLDNVRIARRAAKAAGIDPNRFERQMRQEAGFGDPTSPAGAQGPAQIMPATAADWGVKNVHDPHEAYTSAATHMAGYLRQYGGDWSKALTAYNAGPGRVGGPLPAETKNYIRTVLGSGGSTSQKSPVSVASGTPPKLELGGTTTDTKGAVVAALLDPRKKMSLASRIVGNVSSGDYTTTTKPKVTPGKAYGVKAAAPRAPKAADTTTSAKGTADFEGTKVAAWIAPALAYARAHGWTGKVNSGFRSFADQTRIYNSGVRPAAKPGTSNHEGADYPRGAVDVSEAQSLSAILRNSPYASKLQWAGAKDPVHFSHPHGGSY